MSDAALGKGAGAFVRPHDFSGAGFAPLRKESALSV